VVVSRTNYDNHALGYMAHGSSSWNKIFSTQISMELLTVSVRSSGLGGSYGSHVFPWQCSTSNAGWRGAASEPMADQYCVCEGTGREHDLVIPTRRWVAKKRRRHLARACQCRGFGWQRWRSRGLYDTLGLLKDDHVTSRPLGKAAPAC
jgi:hypothetical protein